MFRMVTVFITRACSIKCPHCLVWKRRLETRPAEYWYRVYNYVWKKIGRHIHISMIGGEPLEYEELEKLICLLGYENYSITSNSISLSEEMAERFVKCGLPNWSVSIDMPEDIGDVRDKAGFRAIRIFRKLGVDDLHVTVTIYPWNVKYLRRLFGELKALYVYIEPTFASWSNAPWYDSFPSSGLVYTNDMVREIRLAVREELYGYEKFHGVKSMFEEDLEVMLNNRWFCKYPHSVTVDENGSMRMCRDVPGRRVKKYDLIKAVDRWDDYVDSWLLDKEEFCAGCNWDCMYQSNKMADVFTHINTFMR